MDEDIKKDRVIDKVEKEESQREVDNSKRKFLKLLGLGAGILLGSMMKENLSFVVDKAQAACCYSDCYSNCYSNCYSDCYSNSYLDILAQCYYNPNRRCYLNSMWGTTFYDLNRYAAHYGYRFTCIRFNGDIIYDWECLLYS